jgi:hypothetical protein
MRTVVIIAALLALTSPAAMAQDSVTAAAFLQTFEDRCAAIAADPEGAIASAASVGMGSGAVTTDKSILQLNVLIELPGASFATLFYQRYVLPADTAAYCTLTVSFDTPGDPIALPDLADLVTATAPDALGAPVTRYGSDVLAEGQPARMYIWSTGDSVNDPSITLNQTATIVTLSAQRPAAD